MKKNNRFLSFLIIINSFALFNVTKAGAQNKYFLYLTYKLPTNPDLVSDASNLQSECTSKHAVCMQACQIGDGKMDCKNRCEQAFRQCLLGIKGVTFWLATCKEGSCKNVDEIIPLSRDEVLDIRLNDVFNEISPGYYSMTGTFVTFSSGIPAFRRTRDNSEISFQGSSVIAQAIANHYDPNSYMKDALYVAIENGQDALMRALLSRGLDPNGANGNYNRPVAAAIQKDRWDIVKDLIVTYKLDISKPIQMNGMTGTLLEYAVSHDDLDIVRLLLDYGADVNACGLCMGSLGITGGSYPLTFAIANKNITMAKFLLSKGADIKNSSYLYDAVIQNDFEMIKYLISQGADVNYYDIETPLTQASFQGNLAIVKILVQHGANINKINNFGETSLDLAEKQNHSDIAAFLRSKGAKKNK